MLKEKVEQLLAEVFEERKDLFLIALEVGAGNEIRVVIDGDKGVSVEDCIEVSRKIEQNLDRDETDFSLEVTSAGISQALVFPRQFKKNLGRKLSVKTNQENFEADLTNATDEEIVLEWKAREPKPVGKGKITVSKKAVLKYEMIMDAKVMVKF